MMNQLTRYKLSELYELASGISSKPEQAGHGFPFCSFSTVFNNAILPEKLPDLMDTSNQERIVYSIKAGDVFLTRTSETVDELAMSSVAVKDYPNATYSGFLKRLRPISDKAYPKYMALLFRSSYFRKTVTNKAVMTLRASFNEDIFNDIFIDLPSIEEQKRIGDLFYDCECRIRNNKAICVDLEALAKLLYDYWFVQFDFPDENGKPYKSSGGKMVWNEDLKREIPEGWEVKQVSDISKRVKVGFVGTVDKYYCSNDEGFPIVRPAEMSISGIDYDSLRHITEEFYYRNKKSQVHKGDVLISRCGKDGIPNIYDSDRPGQVLNAVIIEPDNNMASGIFISEMLKSEYSQVQISHGTSGSVQGVINTEMIAKIILPFNQATVNAFSEFIRNFYYLSSKAKKESQQLASLRDFLLPMLMNGQVKVSPN